MIRPFGRRVWCVIAGIALAIPLAACSTGGSTGSASSAATSSSAHTTAQDAQPSGKSAAQTSVCKAIDSLQKAATNLQADADNPAKAAQDLDDAINALAQVQPPAQLQGVWSQITTALKQAEDSIDSAGATASADIHKLLDSQRFQKAQNALGTYAANHC